MDMMTDEKILAILKLVMFFAALGIFGILIYAATVM